MKKTGDNAIADRRRSRCGGQERRPNIMARKKQMKMTFENADEEDGKKGGRGVHSRDPGDEKDLDRAD